MDGNLQPQLGIQRDAHQVNVQQVTANGFGLPVANHGARRGFAANLQREDGVMAGLRVENLADSLRVDGDRDHRSPAAIDNPRNASRPLAYAARRSCQNPRAAPLQP